MRALTLTQPWCGLVASGIKRIENRPRPMIKPEDFGEPFALHASREIDEDVYRRIFEIAPELRPEFERRWWYMLTRITSAVIGVAAIDKAFTGGWDEETIAEHASVLSFSSGELLGPAQVRWFFGPTAYALRDSRALAEPVPGRGHQGFWTLSPEIEERVVAQLATR